MKLLPLALVALAVLPMAFALDSEPEHGFPLRKKYPTLPVVSTADFVAMDNPIVIDSRTRGEFDVLHVEGAVNLPLENMQKAQLDFLRRQNPDGELIFYGGDFICPVSYKAAEKAQAWGLENLFVYDSGVFEFARTATPERTAFFDRPLEEGEFAKVLLTKADLAARSAAPRAFIDMMRSGKHRIYDVRDNDQRKNNPIRVANTAKLDVKQFITFLQKGVVPTQNILVFDNGGNQVKWLQYHLEHHGIEGYTLLTGGVTQWKAAGFDADGKRSAGSSKARR